jgi:galactose oxidase
MGRPRGYNANCITTDNRIFTLGGEWGTYGNSGTDYYGEIMTLNKNGSNVWRPLKNVSGSVAGIVDSPNNDQSNQNHMWIFPFKDANNKHRVFKAGPSPNMHVIDLAAGTMKYIGKRGRDKMGIQGTAVQFAPGKILTLGGTAYQDNPSDNEYIQASMDAFVLDINPIITNTNAVPTIKGPITRSFRRVCHNAVVLPGGKVLVVGGQTNLQKWTDNFAVLQPELFDPTTNTFTVSNGKLKYARNYHSVALLLKDGRVLVAGGGSDFTGIGCDVSTKGCSTHFDGEIYTPPYLQGVPESKRPKIVSVLNSVTNECASNELDLTISKCKTVAVTMATNACGSGGVTGCTFELIRLSSVTHSINNDQLRIPLVLNSQKNLNTALVSISNTSMPFVVSGYYHLFAINKSKGIPSIASVIRVNRN